MLPAALVMPLVGRTADWMPRERLLVAIDAGRVLLALGACALEATGQPRLALLPVAAGLTTATAASNSVRRALIPLLVGSPGELTAAEVASSIAQAVAQTAGPVLAAVLFSLTSSGVVLLAAVVCFAIAALADSGLPNTDKVAIRPQLGDRPVISARALAMIRAQPELRFATALLTTKYLGRGALYVLVVVVSFRLLHVGSSGVGWLTAAVGAGGVLGGIAAAGLVGRRRLATPLVFGLALWAAAFLAIALVPQLTVAIVALAGLGIGNSLADVAGHTMVGRTARDDGLARVYGVLEALRALAITAGAGVTALVVAVAGARSSLLAAGGFLAAGALVGFLRRHVETAEPPTQNLELLRSNALFGWLAPVALERIAATLDPLELDEGSVLMHEGAGGDRAYLVADGELVAERDGREVGRIGPGDVVGEIALLYDSPRTATVRALTRTRMLGIGREEFLAAATGSAAARAASEDLVEGRLASATAEEAPLTR
jgi:MFS family permease